MHITLLVMGLCLSAAVQAGFYKWTDSQGEVHYSDRPMENAEELRVPGADSSGSESRLAADAGEALYDVFEIAVPEEDQTFRGEKGEVSVSLLLQPGLDEEHRIRLVLNGANVPGTFNVTQLALANVARGTHVLQAHIDDAEGATLMTSKPVRFHVRRALDRPELKP